MAGDTAPPGRELFRRLEQALYLKEGNTWELNQLERVMELCHHVAAQLQERDDLKRSFELFHRASMALMLAYKAAHPEVPGNVWPDMTATNVWAAEQLAACERAVEMLERSYELTPAAQDADGTWNGFRSKLENYVHQTWKRNARPSDADQLVARVFTGAGAQLENLGMSEDEWRKSAAEMFGTDYLEHFEVTMRFDDWLAMGRIARAVYPDALVPETKPAPRPPTDGHYDAAMDALQKLRLDAAGDEDPTRRLAALAIGNALLHATDQLRLLSEALGGPRKAGT
jgi:hypothetical protein